MHKERCESTDNWCMIRKAQRKLRKVWYRKEWKAESNMVLRNNYEAH